VNAQLQIALSLLLFASVNHWCLFSLLCWQSDSIVVRLERTFCFHLFIAWSVYSFFGCFRSVEICGFQCFGFTSHALIFMIDFGWIAISSLFFRFDVRLSDLKESWMLIVIYCKGMLVHEPIHVNDHIIHRLLDLDWCL
jgi:hypothetical protein